MQVSQRNEHLCADCAHLVRTERPVLSDDTEQRARLAELHDHPDLTRLGHSEGSVELHEVRVAEAAHQLDLLFLLCACATDEWHYLHSDVTAVLIPSFPDHAERALAYGDLQHGRFGDGWQLGVWLLLLLLQLGVCGGVRIHGVFQTYGEITIVPFPER